MLAEVLGEAEDRLAQERHVLAHPLAHVRVVVQAGQAPGELLEQLVARRGLQVRDEGRDVAASVGTDRSHSHEQALHLLDFHSRFGPHLQERVTEPEVGALLQGQEVAGVEELTGPTLYRELQ